MKSKSRGTRSTLQFCIVFHALFLPLNHVQVAPHHDCFIHAHIVAASPAGCIVESFTDPERDPLQAELFENPPAISNGWLTLNSDPGLGLTLSEKAIAKFGEKMIDHGAHLRIGIINCTSRLYSISLYFSQITSPSLNQADK